MLASIIHRPGLTYPDPDDFFSPSECYPEYRHGHLARKPNLVYAVVRQAFAQAGLDRARYGSPAWNPLRQLIREGSRVFLLCNFVQHRTRTESTENFLGKCTHGSVLRAVLDYVLLAVGETGRVTFGNAPLQSCDFERVLRETGAGRVLEFFSKSPFPVSAKDLRLLVTERALSGRTKNIRLADPAGGVTVTLDDKSLLRPLCEKSRNGGPAFRVADYDPSLMAAWHDGQKHRYLVHREILESDVIFSVPKLKTHEKVGVTCALKGYVGIVGRKECLPHHRLGSPDQGGDEYPAAGPLVSLSTRLTDWVCRRGQDRPFEALAQIADHTLRRILRRSGSITAGAWNGNDTAWRMALDLARICHYADATGVMREKVQRPNLVLVDGIVGGEAEGPLAPRAVRSASLVFSDDPVFADRLACRLMGFAPDSIPMIRTASAAPPCPSTGVDHENQLLHFNGRLIAEAALRPALGRAFLPPRGWRSSLPA